MKKMILSAAGILLAFAPAFGRDMGDVLKEIEKGNLELQAKKLANSATVYDLAAENMPDAPSVEYSPFFHKGVSGVSSSELVVSQEFDFPTLYSARSKAGKLQGEALSEQYLTKRRDLLLQAKEKCLSIVMLDRQIALAKERLEVSEQLLLLVEKRMKAGDATALEENRVKIEHMDLQTELAGYETERGILADDLSTLAGNAAIDTQGMDYPQETVPANAEQLQTLLFSGDTGMKSAEATVEAMRQEVEVARQGWIPKLSLGYRRNTDGSEASNGFLVGVAFPIYSTGKRVKAATARRAAAELEMENTRARLQGEVKALYNELRQLQKTLSIYDGTLLDESLRLLRKSVDSGIMTMTDYYTEADKINQKKLSYIETENRYHQVLSRINRNSL